MSKSEGFTVDTQLYFHTRNFTFAYILYKAESLFSGKEIVSKCSLTKNVALLMQ